MVEHVEQRGGERQGSRDIHVVCPERQGEAETNEDDPDILDGVIGEQPLEIVLHQGIEHADNGG